MLTGRTPPVRRYGTVLLFLMLGTLAGAWHNRAVDRGEPDAVVGLVRGAVAPPAGALRKASDWIHEQTAWFWRGKTLAQENERLQQRVTELEAEVTRLQEADIKLAQLRKDLGFLQRLPRPPVAADVVALRPDPKFETLLVNRGSRDGVRVHSVAIAQGSVVGQVSEVTPTTATVLLLMDPNASVGARVQRPESRAVGICKGENATTLTLHNLAPDADIRPGDRVVTSGLGGVFPPGLLIGTVTQVTRDAENVNKTAQIQPAVRFDRLEEVYLLP